MKEIQQLLFPEMNTNPNLIEFGNCVDRWRTKQEVHRAFIGQIRAALASKGSSRLIAVGCSPAFDTSLLASEILSGEPVAGPSWASENGVLELPVPALGTGIRDQIKALHDRFREQAGIVNARAKHPERLRGWVPPPRSDTEALISSLKDRGIVLVILRDAENLHPMERNLRTIGGLWPHIADIAGQSQIPHLVVGPHATVWRASNSPQLASKMELVMQRMYGQEKAEKLDFCAILKGLDLAFGRTAELNLAPKTEAIMKRIAGDPMRLLGWLQDAKFHAMQAGESTVTWKHMEIATPTAAEVEAAKSDLHAYQSLLESRLCEFPLPPKEPDPAIEETGQKKGKRPRPGERALTGRDQAFNVA